MTALSRLRAASRPRERLLAAVLALLAGVTVFVVASELFPYHSSNHDEGVYLQQAALLLDGQLQIFPGGFGSAVRPWFFVDGGDSFYPKYQPLPAAFYAVGMALFDQPRVVLAAFGAGNTALVYALGSVAFDRRIGVVAAAGFAFAPMTLVSSSVFLPYAPTTFFNLAFAVSYLHSYRTGRRATAGIAGLAIGVAFFMRPYTAVLFATPFIVHALWEVGTCLRERRLASGGSIPGPVGRQATTAALGSTFVALALAYNVYLTGSPLLFPFEAFAPLDGPGFGRRRILGHSIEYTPTVAVRSNATVLWYLLTRWVPAGAFGTALAAVGLAFASGFRGGIPSTDGEHHPTARGLLAGLFVTVPLGNLFFWGNFNVLANPADPTDGLLGQFGPFYHFDLLAPIAVFGAAGAVGLWRRRGVVGQRLEGTIPSDGRRAIALSVLLLSVLLAGGLNAALLSGPVDRNAAHTETYEDAYAPFEKTEFENALVFLPMPYGPWLNHPFQYLRNDPGFDGDAVYVLDRGTGGDFEALEAAGDRTPYRYTYRGEWTGDPEDREIAARLQQLSVGEGETLGANTTVGVPERVSHAVVRIETDDGYGTYTVENPTGSVPVEWTFGHDSVSVDRVSGVAVGNVTAELDPFDEVVLTVRFVQQGAGTLTYRQEVDLRQTDSGVSVIWPPERTVCPIVDDCGREGTFLPDRSERRFETTLAT